MALKPLNSVGGFSVGETPANIILANGDITANAATFSGNLLISNATASWGIKTDNLYYSNGLPWDLQEAAGANTQIQYNINNNFAASANFTFDPATNLLIVNGNSQFNNANLGNLATANIVNVSQQVNGNVANFSGNLTAANANLGNLATANFVNVSSNVNVTNTMQAGNVRTDNLLYANGNPWDLQEAAGANTQIQYNINNNFAASANFTYNDATQVFAVTGNANITNTVNTPNINAGTSTSLNLTANGYSAYLYANSNALFPGNITANAFIGNFSGNVSAGGTNTQVQFNDGNTIAGANGLTYDKTSNLVSISGNVNLGLSGQNQLINLSNTALEIRGGWDAASSTAVNIAVGDYSNNTNWAKLSIQGNVSGNSVGFSEANAFIFTNPGYGLGNVVKVDILNPAASSTTTGVIQANGGIGVTGNGYFGGNIVVTGDIANANNISVTNTLNAVTGNFSGNINSLNANLGNLATANYVNVANDLNGNIANFTGNLTSLNANLGNLATANYVNVANDLNVIGNVNAGNLVGTLANGTSNVRIFQDANIEFSSNTVSNIVTISNTGLFTSGNIHSTAGYIIANGNVTANGFLVGANAVVTGEANLSSVLTSNITANGNLTITASGTDKNITLVPGGPNGVIEASLARIVQVGGPTQPKDAATKEYVDSTSVGLTIHQPVRVTSVTNLNATYANGGSVLTTIAITGGKTIQFSAAHGLSIGDELAWDNSFNNIIGDDPYFVYSTPAADTITVKAGYFGAEVTTLTNGTGLSQTARANTGVGATLTNAGANAALSIDSVALASTNRVLVQGQTNQFENGVYTVTTVGDGSTAWVLTRAPEEDTYSPKSTTGMGYGDYFFVQQGTNNAGSSYALTSPVGEILFGLTNIGYSQFSAAGSYTAGNGIAINGTVISANVDNDTTAIVGGNITVKVSANLVTPNLGDATFSSLSWNTLSNGNVSANNLSIGNIANITLDLTVGGNIQANGTISSNANVSGLNLTTSGNVHATGNVLANNVNANTLLTVPTANVSNIVNAGNVAVTNALTGNTANFSGNVILPNLTVNLELAGNTANFSGNIKTLNANLGNLVTANFANFTNDVVVQGNIANANNINVTNTLNALTGNFSGNVTSLNANLGNLATANFVNVASNTTTSNLTVNLELAGNTANFTGNISVANANLGNLATANFINVASNITANVMVINTTFTSNTVVANSITSNNVINIGNTAIYWATLTTSTVTANQTIATIATSGITGYEFIVKGVDSTGSKYSVATVTAVTNGTSADYVTFATATLGGSTGTLAVNVVGSNIELQVTPASSNSTVWITQFRTI
jgi:hypothetical protein